MSETTTLEPPVETSTVDPDRAAFDSLKVTELLDNETTDPEPQQTDPDPTPTDSTKGKPQAEADPEPEAKTAKVTEKAKPEADKGTTDQPDFKLSNKGGGYADRLGLKDATPVELFNASLKGYERDGTFDDDALVVMYSKDHDAFVEQGLKRAVVQRDQDELGKTAKNLQRQLAQEKPSVQAEAPPMSKSMKDLITETISGFGSSVVNDLGDLDTEALEQALSVVLTTVSDGLAKEHEQSFSALTKQYTEERQQMAKVIQDLGFQWVESELARSRERLLDQYPDLKDETVYKRALTRYDTLVNSDEIAPSVHENFTEAVKSVLGDQTSHQLRERMLQAHRQRKSGQPRPPTQVPQKPVEGDQKLRQQFNRAMDKAHGAKWR